MIKQSQRGFTLIELLVVISIIGLISTIVLSSVTNARKEARDKKRVSEIHQIVTGLQLHAADNSNTLLSTGGAWKCLGHATGQFCFADNLWQGDTTLNNTLNSYIRVPDDPLNNTACYGDAYAYNSNFSLSGNPTGAYLHWFIEDTGGASNRSCGRGVYTGSVGSCGGACWLYVGPAS